MKRTINILNFVFSKRLGFRPFLFICFLLFTKSNLNSQSGDWGRNGNLNVDSTDFIGTLDSASLKFKTDATQRMIITERGNIGVGITNPEEKLSVSGNIQSLNLSGTPNRIVLASTTGTLLPGPPISSILLSTGNGSQQNCPHSVWLTSGNSGGFQCKIGTLDYFPVNIVSNGQSRIRVKEDGRISIGPSNWNSTSQFQANTLTTGYLNDRHFLGLNAQIDPISNRISVLFPFTTIYHGHGAGLDLDAQKGKLKIGLVKNGLHFLNGISIGIDGHTGVGMESDYTTSILPNASYFSFSVNGNSRFTSPGNPDNAIYLGHDGGNAIIERYGAGDLLFGHHSSANCVFANDINVEDNALFQGNVMIGCTTSTHNGVDYVLNAKGKLRAEGIRVYNTWSDYVFDEKYALLPIDDLKKFILENHHLPGIPSAKEVENDGIDLGPMQAKLLEKIEELTLYIIDLKDEIENMKQNSIPKALKTY